MALREDLILSYIILAKSMIMAEGLEFGHLFTLLVFYGYFIQFLDCDDEFILHIVFVEIIIFTFVFVFLVCTLIHNYRMCKGWIIYFYRCRLLIPT